MNDRWAGGRHSERAVDSLLGGTSLGDEDGDAYKKISAVFFSNPCAPTQASLTRSPFPTVVSRTKKTG